MADDSTAYLILGVAGTACALPRESVAEVLPLPELQASPASGSWLTGFVNLSGHAIPVLDLAVFLGLRASTSAPGLYAHLVLVRDRSVAWLVDRVDDLVSVAATAHRPADPEVSLNGCVTASVMLGARLVPALDPARLLTAAERARLDGQARAAADRLAALPEPPAASTEPLTV